ncbi:MAG TPA: hypothetical protein VJH97_03650 [Candidatus Nanoarchaeia archaeon]|nr:hypothetical protein [Candidatus Nanoarchaeia archaeon]
MANAKENVIRFGKYHEHVQIDGVIKEAHELTEKEKSYLIQDFKRVKKLEKAEEAELKAIKHFEKKLQELIENVVFLDGYIQQIEEGNTLLKINGSVKELGARLNENIDEVEKLSQSVLDEERKILGLAKHVRHILEKAKRYQALIFG